MFQYENKQINTVESLKKSIGSKTVSFSNDVLEDTITINRDVIKLKKSNISLRGGVNIIFKDVKKGDILEFSGEFKNINGSLGRISIYEMQNMYIDSTFTLIDYIVTDNIYNSYQTIKNKFLAIEDYPNLSVSFGVWMEDTCELDMKNIKATLCRQSFKKEYRIKPYCIEKKTTGWVIRDDMTRGDGIITIQNTNTLRITYDIPFNSRPIMGTVNTPFGGGQKYELLNLYNQQDYIDFQIVERDTNTIINLSDIAVDTIFHLTLIGE